MFSAEKENRSCEACLLMQQFTRQQGCAQGFCFEQCVLGIASIAQEGACCHRPLCAISSCELASCCPQTGRCSGAQGWMVPVALAGGAELRGEQGCWHGAELGAHCWAQREE